MARKKRKARSPAARIPVSDEELIKRLEQEHPEMLSATMPETLFDTAIEGLLKEWPLPDEMPHFYCRKCGEYHLKTHSHYCDGPS
jgi:hypothetical protein